MPSALIWGASGGIGRALVQELNENGWAVYAAARRTENIPDEAEATFEFDARDAASFEQTAMLVAQQAGQVDLVVYAAGDIAYEKLDSMDYAAWTATLDSNLNGAFLAAHESLPLMDQGTHMMFIGAYLDHIRLPKMGAYAVAKAGLAELVTLLAKENRRKHFTLVRPGAVDTAFYEQVSFSTPKNAKAPAVVAKAMREHYEAGQSGELNLD